MAFKKKMPMMKKKKDMAPQSDNLVDTAFREWNEGGAVGKYGKKKPMKKMKKKKGDTDMDQDC